MLEVCSVLLLLLQRGGSHGLIETDQEGGRLNNLSVVGVSLGVSSLVEEAATTGPNSPLSTVTQVGFFL